MAHNGEPNVQFTPFKNVSMCEPRKLTFADTEAVVFTRSCPGKDTLNEDSAVVLIDDATLLIAVADGAGGYVNGHESSAIATQALIDAIQERPGERLVRGCIMDAFENGHERIKAQTAGAATTFAVVEIAGSTLRTYHTGDSGVLVTGAKGKLKLQTLSHSPTGYAVESGLMEEQDALTHEERHYVSNLLGKDPMSIEIGSPTNLARRDTIVVGSDGLFDNLYSEEIAEIVRKGPIDSACDRLIEAVYDRMNSASSDRASKPDDLTVILARRIG